MTRILLVDNGSRRAEATLALRRLSEQLAQRLGRPVQPVSLLHSSKVPAAALGGCPAETLEPFLEHQAANGARDFLAVPLFFGRSRALTNLIPQTVERVNARLECQLQVSVAEELCPLPQGEPRLAAILDRAIRAELRRLDAERAARPAVVLVDHGSPIPEVTAVRHWLANQLAPLSKVGYPIQEAAMERREGVEYAFNGDLLEEALAEIAATQPQAGVVVAMQFIGPGRHAGPGGDVNNICREAQQRYPGLEIRVSTLVGEDDALLDILVDRTEAALGAGRSRALDNRELNTRDGAAATGQSRTALR